MCGQSQAASLVESVSLQADSAMGPEFSGSLSALGLPCWEETESTDSSHSLRSFMSSLFSLLPSVCRHTGIAAVPSCLATLDVFDLYFAHYLVCWVKHVPVHFIKHFTLFEKGAVLGLLPLL